jgi:hypothetical protein
MPGTETRQAPPDQTMTVLLTAAKWSTPPWEMAPEAVTAAVLQQDELAESARHGQAGRAKGR